MSFTYVFWIVDEFLWKKFRGNVLFIGNEEQMCVMSVWGEMEICAAMYHIRFFPYHSQLTFGKH